MKKTKSIADIIATRKALAESKISIAIKALPTAMEKNNADLAHFNVRSAGSGYLLAAMVCARHDKDYGKAMQYCAECAGLANILSIMAERGLKGTPWSGMYVLYCGLIAGRLDKAEQVAKWMLQCPIAPEELADPHDPIALLSGYAVLGMKEEFERIKHTQFDSSWHTRHTFFGPLCVYLDIWHAILLRDQAKFDAAMKRRDEHHIQLSKQRGDGRMEFGGGSDSKLIVDFMGIGCAIMARRCGLSCDTDTIYVPRAMIEQAIGISS